MTSTNDGKDVKSNQTSAPKGKSHYIELYKSLESRLSEVRESSERTQHLCSAWSQVHTLCLHSAQSTQSHLLSWLQRHTARTILQTEWQTPKRKEDRARLESAINTFISQCQEASEERDQLPWETLLVARGEWFKKVLDRPWDHPVLNLLLNPNGTPPTDDEVLKWLKEERGVTFVMRLHTLVGEKCDDIAASLAAAVMERVRGSTVVTPDLLQVEETKDKPKPSPVSSFGEKLSTEAGFTPDVWELLTDIEFVLLHKRDSSRCIALAKQTPLRSAYQLVERLQSRLELSPKEKRLWKNAKDVAILIAQVVIARCMVVPSCAGVARGALYCCSKSLARALGARLAPAAAALAAPAASAKHLHTLAQAVDAHFAQSNDNKMKPFVCELYVRAITAGMNELERLKLKTEKESEARQMEKTLCQWFMQLGSVLNASDRIMCECTLTAFSVHPSVQMYEKIKEAPHLPKIVEQIEPKLETKSEFGSWASDSRSQTNFVKTSETLNMKAQQQANVLSTAIFNEGEALGLSPDLCQDIAVLLSGPRVKTLTWDMDREQLIEHCRIYMERTHQGTRALTTELKFLNLNPKEFMHLPEEEDDEDDVYYGIEKGYEHLVPLQDPNDIWNDTNDPERTESAQSAAEEKEIIIPHRKKKSKPLSSDDEKDPLSLVAENKRIDKKKERPHSKERSKERKKKEPGEVRVKEPKEKKEKKKRDKDKPDKEKKERKKKEKVLKTEALANLVGLKVANTSNQDTKETGVAMANIRSCISDSDYDSQGKSSMTSINSVESDVLFDGHFSMDEFKSPEHSSNVDNIGLMKNNELSVSNGKVGLCHSSIDQQKLRATELLNQAPLNSVSEDVKRSIYKLIDYRRQRAAIQQTDNPLPSHQSNFDSAKDYLNRQNPVKILNNTLQSSESKLYNTSSSPSTSLQSCISPKAVTIPEIPKSIINKKHSDKLAQLRREIDNILATKNKPIASNSVQSPVIQYAKKSTEDLGKSFKSNQAKSIVYPPGPTQQQNPIRMKDLVTVGQERYGPYEVTKPVFAQTRPSLPVHRPPITETPGESSYKKFLAEFQRTIDTPQTKRQIKPVSRVTPVIPHVKADLPAQRAKPLPQPKKPDNTLNTFSRRSYMYKNKQADVKKASEASQGINSSRPTLGSKIEDFVWEHLHRSSQNQTPSYSSLSKVSNEYAQSVKRSEMTKRPVSNSQNDAILSQFLRHTDSMHTSTSTCARVNPPKSVAKSVTPPKSYLSEQDQVDLIKLLRLQNTLNSTPQPVKQQMHNTVSPPPLASPSGQHKDNTVLTKTPTNKLINILSSTIIKPPSKTTAVNTKSTIIHKKSMKSEIEHTKKTGYKTDSKKSDDISSEFQSVFNALRAQKTPSRGPNALDVALNKSSFEKAFEDSLRKNHNVVIPDNKTDTHMNKSYNPPKPQDNIIISASDHKNVKSKAKGKSVLKTYEQRKESNVLAEQKKQLEIPKANETKAVIHKKQVNVEPKKCLSENLKKKVTYVKNTEDDPFISGIHNSDYDLLEELMDDDLRKEIGELSSDEESYTAQATNLTKQSKTNVKNMTDSYNKPIEISPQPAKPVVQPQTVKQDVCVERPPVKCVYENKAVQGQSKPQTIPICSKISDTCSKIIASSNAQHNTQIHSYSNASTFASNNMATNSNIYMSTASQPPAQNVVLIGSNIVYEGYSALPTPIHTVTNTAYVVNSMPDMTLYQPTQYVQPIINPVIIESTVPPLISTVQYSSISVETNAVSNSINPELINQNLNNDIQASRLPNMPQQTSKSHEEVEKKESRLSNNSARNIQQNSHSDIASRPCLKEPTVISTVTPKTCYSAPMQPKISAFPEHIITKSSELISKREESKYINITENIALDTQFKQDSKSNLEYKTTNLSEHTVLSEHHIKQDSKISEIINKTIERKVLSEVQEKQIISPEKQVTPETTETKVKYQTIDYDKPLKTSQDQERLIKKRMAIINRKISHYSEETPIPLSYSSLSPANNSMIETKYNSIEDVSSKKSVPQESERGESVPQNVKDNCKENKSDGTPCRRILLRSSNKLQNKVTSDIKLTPKKVTKKTDAAEKVIDKTNNQNGEEKPVKLKRESKRIRNKTINKKKTPEKQQKLKLNIGRKAPLKIKHKKVSRMTPLVTETQPIHTVDPLDFEAQLLSAKILKKQPPEPKIENNDALNESQKDNKMVSTVTDMDSNEQQILTEESDNDKEYSKTTENYEINESESNTTQSAKTNNVITKHPTKEIVYEESALLAVVVPNTVNEIQESNVTQMSVLDKKDTVDEIDEKSIPKVNSKPAALDMSRFVNKQENSNSNLTDPKQTDENVDNNNDLLHSEFKDCAISSDNHDKTEKLRRDDHDKADIVVDTEVNLLKSPDTDKYSTNARTTKNELDLLKKTDSTKLCTDVSQIQYNKLLIPSANNIDDDVEIIDGTKKLEETRLKDAKSNSNDITISDIPQSYKDSISIEPIPSRSSDNPLKKCVRIKLPNGRVFKATVTGEVSVNFDTLFAQPSLKSVLINNLNYKKKYTLNIKQVTTVSKHDHKVLSTQIQEVNELPRNNLGHVIDTVNLLSDDEDEIQQEFETEFGKYKIQTMNTDSYHKHREKLKLRPIIVLEKKEIRQNNSALENAINLVCNDKIEELKSGKGIEEIILPLNNQAKAIESDIDEVVLIDDSSDDDISDKYIPEKGIDKLKDNLLKDLGVGITETNDENDTEVLKEKLLMDLGLNIDIGSKETDKSARVENSKVIDSVPLVPIEIPEIDLTEDSTPVELKTSTNVNKTIDCKTIDSSHQCYVKLVRCDYLVTTSSSQGQPMEQVAEPELDCLKPRSRSNSFSILDNFPLLNDVVTTYTNLDRSSPVIEVFDIIASRESFMGQKLQTIQPKVLLCNVHQHDDPVLAITCSADWFETKKTVNVSNKMSTTVSSPLPLIDDTPVIELPSLTSLTLKYLQDSNLITILKPIRGLNVLKTLKRKSESSQTLGSPKISKPTLEFASKFDIIGSDLTDASMKNVLSEESNASVETSDLLNDFNSCVVSSALQSCNLGCNGDSEIQKADYTAASSESTLNYVLKQGQSISNSSECLESISSIPKHVEYGNEMVETDAMQESDHSEPKIENFNAMVEDEVIQRTTSKKAQQLGQDNSNMVEIDAFQESLSLKSEGKIEDANGIGVHVTDDNMAATETIQASSNAAEQILEDDDDMTDIDVIQESMSKVSEQNIEDSHDNIKNDVVQYSTSKDPEQLVEDDDNMTETDAIQKSPTNTEQKVEDTNDMVEEIILKSMLNNSVQKIEDSNDVTDNNTVQQTTSNNPEQLVGDDDNVVETNAIKEPTSTATSKEAILESMSNISDQKIEESNDIIENDTVHQLTSKNPEQLVEVGDKISETNQIWESTSNPPVQNIEEANSEEAILNSMSNNSKQKTNDSKEMIENDTVQQSTPKNKQLVADGDNVAESDAIQEFSSHTHKQKIEDASDTVHNDSMQKSTNFEQFIEDNDDMAETDCIQELITYYTTEQQIENVIESGHSDSKQKSNTEQVVENDNNVAETGENQVSFSNTLEQKINDNNYKFDNNSFQKSRNSEHEQQENVKNHVMQKTIMDDEEPEIANNDIADNNANLQQISNDSKIESNISNYIVGNNETDDENSVMNVSIIDNHDLEATVDNETTHIEAIIHESISNKSKHDIKDSNNIAFRKKSVSDRDNPDNLIHDTQDRKAITKEATHSIGNQFNKESNECEVFVDDNITEIQESTSNNHEDATEIQNSMDNSHAIQETILNNLEHNPNFVQDIVSNNTKIFEMEISCERDSLKYEHLKELPLDTVNGGYDVIENNPNEVFLPNNSESIEIKKPEVGQQKDLRTDTKLNENIESGLSILSRAAELYSYRKINDSPEEKDIASSNSNIENTTTSIESLELNKDVEFELSLKTTPGLVTEDVPDILIDVNIVKSTDVSNSATRDFKIGDLKNENIKPEKGPIKLPHDTIETKKDIIQTHLDGYSVTDTNTEITVTTSVPSTTKELDRRLEVIDDQENSNQNPDGTLKWKMSIANADQIMNEPLESNTEQIITKILKLTGKEGSEVVLKGIQYEDPRVGTCYMFPLIEQNNQSVNNQSEVNLDIPNQDEIINLIQETTDDDIGDNFEIVIPTHTYTRQNENVSVQRILKRKKSMSDVKIQEKRYRKGKNIDYPKFTAASMSETVYIKEYTRLMEYCSTVKFSYSRPFHKEHVEVNELLRNWPIVKTEEIMTTDEIQENLFTEVEEQDSELVDPLEQTLAQELTSEYNENDYKPINIVETNFNMGFGERSDRVIHYTKKTETNILKLSAATLSDVKPYYQPYLTNRTELKNIVPEQNGENVKLLHVKFMEMRDRVRTFFQKTAVDLVNDALNVTKKSEDINNFPFGLTSTEFLTPLPQEVLINVVQVGQLPVSASAQNPVTCDPRVTHVTNVSPSQCSAENSPGDDNQIPIKTEYTELTTADINLPLVQEYAHHLQQLSASNCQEPSQTQNSDSSCVSTEIKAQIKIELTEESSQERLEDEAYEQLTSASDNNNINNGAYHYHEVTNSTMPDNASHVQQSFHNAILEAMNGQSNNNNTTVDVMNGHNFNNSIIQNAMNGQNPNATIKEEIDFECSNNTILDNVLNGQNKNTSTENTVTNQINNHLPVNNIQGQNNTTAEQARNEQRSNNTAAEITVNGTTIVEGFMNDQNMNNTPEQVLFNEKPNNIPIANNVLNGQDPNNTNAEEPKNDQPLNSTVEEAVNCLNGNDSGVGERTNQQNIPQEPKHSSAFSETNCDQQIDKTDQLAHAMNAAGITPSSEVINTSDADALVDIISQNAQSDVVTTSQTNTNNFTKSAPINAMALQQALAQILPPPLNQTVVSDNAQNSTNAPPVLHIVQGSNSQTVINKQNGTPLLHIVQNKTAANGVPTSQANSFSGLSLVDTGLQQGGNQLLHIVNTGNQKNNNAGQLLKRVNLLTNIANVQGSNEQKMVQFVCKSADGKSIQLNAPHQRSMVLRLQPIDPSTIQTAPKPTEPVSQDVSPNTGNTLNNKDACQQDIKSRSVYEENYAKFIQNGTDKPGQEKATSLPKFNQVFGKQVYQENKNEINNDGMSEHTDGQQTDNNVHLDGINDINSPPLLLRKSPPQTSQAQVNLVQQIKQTIAPMNIQTMHGGVIYTRQIPVNIGGGQTINLITVPSTELVDDSNQKQPTDGNFIHKEGDHVIKIVPQSQTNNVSTEENNPHVSGSNETPQNPQPQPQPVLTQMRIKLPMLSKAPHMVSGARVVRPSFFQIQRNVIGGANQPVYQQLVLTTAPSLGQTIRVPAQTKPTKPPESQSSPESQMSSSTLEQLREFDMVLEQVKERSTVNPGTSHSSYSNKHSSADTTDSSAIRSKSVTETTQVMYTTENNQTIASYVNRKSTVTSASTSTFVRSPDSSGIVESPSSSTHSHIPHTSTSTSTSESTSSETPLQPKPKKKKKSSVSSSNPAMKMPPATPKPSSQKPLEDEQTTQRILYILAEYKEQVENSPDKDKPAPRRRNNLPPNLGSSKRKKSSSGSRRRDMSPIHGEDSCRTMGSEDSSCGTSLGECAECMESHSPQESPRKVVRKLTFEQETTQITTQTRTTTIPQRNVIVADGQTITVARGPTGKPATTVLMPANYLLPVSMVKGGQQIAIVTNRGPKLLVGGEGGTGGTLLFQRLIGPAGLKPVLTRPGVRHIRLPTAALHNLQAFNIATHAATTQPADSTASPASAPTPPDLVDTRAMSSPWPDREAQEAAKPDRGSSPEGSEPWNLPSSSIADDYGYEEIVRTDNMDRTVLDAIPDRYSPDMEAQRIFDKMFDVDSKKSMYDTRCGYDIDASDTDDRPYQVVQRRDGRHHRLTHVSAAALRHKYAILEHELRLQKSLSEECEDLGVDSPSAAELFPEAELFFAPSPVHEQTIGPCHTPQPTILNQGISQPDLDDQIATDHLLTHQDQELDINLDDVGEIVTVGEDGMTTIPLDHEEFARSHPNTTFHTEPEEGEIPPFTISQSIKGRQITFHAGRSSGTVVMAPQTTVISQATVEASGTQNTVKFTDIDNMINAMPTPQQQTNIPSSVLVKDSGLTRFDNILTDTRELHLSNNTASAIVHSTGQGTQVIRRIRYDDRRDQRYTIDDHDATMEEKIDDNRDLESMAGDDASSPERHPELFWESNSASERSEGRRRLDFSSDSDKCCKSPFDEGSTDSSFGNHTRLDSVIKAARTERSGSGSSDDHPPLRTYPPKRVHAHHEGERSVSGKTRAGEGCGDSEARRRASARGVVKRGCHCCADAPPAPKPKKSRHKKPSADFATP